MIRRFSLTVFLMLVYVGSAAAQYAVEVVAYDQGATAAEIFGSDPPAFFNQNAAALGSPERFTGEGGSFPGAVTAFNAPFLPSEIVSVGEGGFITLRLSNFVVPQSSGPEIGVFTNSTLIAADRPNGIAGDPASVFGADSAEVGVSADGINWVSLGTTTFNIPMNGYSDTAQTVASDFQLPFTNPLSDFSGLPLSDANGADILGLFGTSGGGTWLDISGTGLPQVGFVRFSVDDDNDENLGLNFELDAVSIARDAMGAATVPEPSSGLMVVLASLLLVNSRRGRQRRS